MIEVDNVPPDPKERTPMDARGLSEGSLAASPTRLVSQPDPCPICGAPAGACTTHTDPFKEITPGPPVGDAAIVPRTVPASRRVRVQGTEDTNTDPDSKVYVCTDDVVEVFESGIPGKSTRKSRRLVHRKGEVIPRDRAIQLGLIEGTITPPPVPPPPRRVVEGQPVTVPQL